MTPLAILRAVIARWRRRPRTMAMRKLRLLLTEAEYERLRAQSSGAGLGVEAYALRRLREEIPTDSSRAAPLLATVEESFDPADDPGQAPDGDRAVPTGREGGRAGEHPCLNFLDGVCQHPHQKGRTCHWGPAQAPQCLKFSGKPR